MVDPGIFVFRHDCHFLESGDLLLRELEGARLDLCLDPGKFVVQEFLKFSLLPLSFGQLVDLSSYEFILVKSEIQILRLVRNQNLCERLPPLRLFRLRASDEENNYAEAGGNSEEASEWAKKWTENKF